MQGAPATSAVVVATPADDAPGLASWPARVLAALLDDAVLIAVTWLAFPVQTVAPPSLSPTIDLAGDTVAAWWSSPWVVVSVALLLVMQAYLGVTPGKLVLGVAVVDARTGRPVGLPRTLLRWAAHLLDALVWVGYLRPLWHERRQTFADSVVGTVALATRRPLPHTCPARSGPQAAPAEQQPASTHSWRTVATALAVVVCTLGAWFALAVSGSSTVWSSTCVADGSAQGALAGGSISWSGEATERRGWVSRPVPAPDPSLTISWPGTVSAGDDWASELRVVVTGPDGRVQRSTAPDPLAQALTDGHVTLPVAGGLGAGSRVETSLIGPDGTTVGTCTVVAPG